MRKGQIFGKPVMFLLALVILGTLIYIGFKGISNINEYASDNELRNFFTSLQNSIDEQAKEGKKSSKEITLTLSKRIESVCLVDKNKEYDELTNLKLNDQIEIDDTSNIFFFPSKENIPFSLNNLELENSPLCIKNINGQIRLMLTDNGEKTLVEGKKDSIKKDCSTLLYNKGNNIDIVFIGQKYSNSEKLLEDANNFMQKAFLEVEPIKSNIDNFNFYIIEDETDLLCKTSVYARCDEYSVNKIVSNCPHDYIVILIDRNYILDLISPVRSSAIANIATINTNDYELVLSHEFGHMFADLADEYVDDNFYSNFDPKEYPNCDTRECPKFSVFSDTGCYEGCSLSNYFRGTQESIMRDYYESSVFGSINENEISNKISKYGG